MRIITTEEFYKLPAGTVYCKYSEVGNFADLCIKLNTLHSSSENKPIDYSYIELIGNVDANDSTQQDDLLREALKTGKEFNLDFDYTCRDGLYNNYQLYAVYNQEEVLELANLLISTIK